MMKFFSLKSIIAVAGSGAMGAGIAHLAANSGHKVTLYDMNEVALENAKKNIKTTLDNLAAKQKISIEKSIDIFNLITFSSTIGSFNDADLVIEAIVENIEIKKKLFSEIESFVSKETILASNTSSLSIASIASACNNPERVMGIHFFNPATLMPLVEIIPAVQTDRMIVPEVVKLIDSWSKVTVLAKDTPGFIVNRIARPFYSESIRIYEEGIADVATIDWAMKEIGKFRMGPFELMDYIGHDVNYVVTETIFKEFFYDPRYKPSFSQKRLLEAKRLGKKSGIGFYNYSQDAEMPNANKDLHLGEKITERVLAMLMNEAIDALYLNIASAKDIDLAMTKGVNYPKGLLAWANEWGLNKVLQTLEKLQSDYGEDRYRPSYLLKKMVALGNKFLIID
jgi:3-hydroxybutyryl-CoA dehydrogenase